MSSLDSTLNSLSALTMNDILDRFFPRFTERHDLWISKVTTVFWGAACLVFSFYVGGISDSIIESINKITSLISGPLLGVFLLGLLTRRTNEVGAVTGLIAGFLTNMACWIWAGDEISWLWWNVIGLVVCVALGLLATLLSPAPAPGKLTGTLAFDAQSPEEITANRRWIPFYLTLAAYAVLLFVILVGFNVVA
jgi:SSS family solute:Na+ symporter